MIPAMRRRLTAILTAIALGSVCPAAQQPPGGSVTGFVRSASGEAIADVRVVLVRRGKSTARSTWTGADGSYRIGAIVPGDYQLSVSLRGGVAKLITIDQRTALAGLNFSIPDGSSRRVVAGRVVMNAASQGRPIPSRISAAHGPTTVYSLDRVGGKRLAAAAFAITVPPEPEPIAELVVTLGSFR